MCRGNNLLKSKRRADDNERPCPPPDFIKTAAKLEEVESSLCVKGLTQVFGVKGFASSFVEDTPITINKHQFIIN